MRILDRLALCNSGVCSSERLLWLREMTSLRSVGEVGVDSPASAAVIVSSLRAGEDRFFTGRGGILSWVAATCFCVLYREESSECKSLGSLM